MIIVTKLDVYGVLMNEIDNHIKTIDRCLYMVKLKDDSYCQNSDNPAYYDLKFNIINLKDLKKDLLSRKNKYENTLKIFIEQNNNVLKKLIE